MNAVPLFEPDPMSGRGFSMRDLVRLVFKHLGVVLGATLVVGVLSVYGALRQPKLYTATAQVWVKTEQQGTPSFLSGVSAYREATAQDPPSRRIETEMSLLVNRSSLDQVVRRLALRPEQLKRKPLVIATEPFAAWVARELDRWGLGSDEPTDPVAATVKVLGESLVLEPLRSKGSDTSSNVIQIKLTGTDRDVTQRALAEIIGEYRRRSSAQNLELGLRALHALQEQVTSARAELGRAEDAIVRYAVGSAAATVNTYVPRAELDSSAPLIATQPTEVGQASVPTVTAKLRADVHQLQAQLDAMRDTFTDDYEGVRNLKDSLSKLRGRMLSESRQTARTNASMAVLNRSRGMAQARYLELQRKLDQIDLYLKLGPTEVDARLDTELPREAEKLSRVPVVAAIVVGPVVGLLLGLLLAGLLDLGDRRLQSPEAVARYLRLEVLAAMPRVGGSSGRRQGRAS